MTCRSSALEHLRVGLTILSIGANAICAGGIFTFPLMSPALASHLKLTQPQLTSIVLAGVAGQYPFAAVVGRCVDKYGPWACSLLASIMFSSAFGLFALEISRAPDDIIEPSASSAHLLTFYFLLAGFGTVFSYFSSLFAASKNFTRYSGFASGATLATFGLSPLFLSLLATSFFTSEETGLDLTRYLTFLAILTGVIHVVGAFNLRTPPLNTKDVEVVTSASVDDPEVFEDNEGAPLLPGKRPDEEASAMIATTDEDGSILDLVKDPYFWILCTMLLLVLGASEMVQSNIGTIVLSLPSSSSSTPYSIAALSKNGATSTQVQALSLANTLSRLLVGPVADLISPIASWLPNGNREYSRKHFISRMSFMSAAIVILAITFIWTVTRVRSQGELMVLSIGTGISYGTIWTVLPSIISSVWGLKNAGRNFGAMTYAPFIGTPIFSYIYAFVSEHNTHAGEDGICKGVSCWKLTFWLCAVASLVSFCGSLILWRRWKGKI